MQKYSLEFILNVHNATLEAVKNSLTEFGENLEVLNCQDKACQRSFKISICTEDPTAIFDICAQFGRIRQVKVSEEGG